MGGLSFLQPSRTLRLGGRADGRALYLGVLVACIALRSGRGLGILIWVCERLPAALGRTGPAAPRVVSHRARRLRPTRGPSSGRRSCRIVIWVVNAAGVEATFRAFSLDLPPYAAFLVLGTIAVALVLPSAPGYVGPSRSAPSRAWPCWAWPRETALSLSIVYHLANYIPITLVGLAYLSGLNLTLGELRDGQREERMSTSAATASGWPTRAVRRSPSSSPSTTRKTTSVRCSRACAGSWRGWAARTRSSSSTTDRPTPRVARLRECVLELPGAPRRPAAHELRPDRRAGGGLRPRPGRLRHHPRRGRPERPGRHPATARQAQGGLRRRQRLAPRAAGPLLVPAAPLPGRQRPDLVDHRGAPARLRLRPQGLPPRDPPGRGPVRRDASLPARAVPLGGRHGRGASREPLAAAPGRVEVRPGAHGAGPAGSPHRQVPHELLDPPDPDLRAPGARAGRARHRPGRRTLVPEDRPRDGPRQPPAPPARRAPRPRRLPVRLDRPPGRDARSHVPRVTAQTGVHDSRDFLREEHDAGRSRLVR